MNSKEKIAIKYAMNNFRESYKCLALTIKESNIDVAKDYPFEKSFDEYNVDKWVNSILAQLKDKKIPCAICGKMENRSTLFEAYHKLYCGQCVGEFSPTETKEKLIKGTTLKEKIEIYLGRQDYTKLIGIVQELRQDERNLQDLDFIDMSCFNDELAGFSSFEIAEIIGKGNFKYQDDCFSFGARGELHSYSDKEVERIIRGQLDEIAETIIDDEYRNFNLPKDLEEIIDNNLGGAK
jgi:hypothetical protein